MRKLTKSSIVLLFLFPIKNLFGQNRWVNVDSSFQPLPENFHVYKTTDSLDGKPFIAYYAKAKLKDRHLVFTTDTSRDRRLIPQEFYKRNDHPLLVVNCTFFSYETNRSLNIVMNNGKILAYNNHTIPMRGKDTFQYRHPFTGALGIDKKRRANVVWVYSDSTKRFPFASEFPVEPFCDSSIKISSRDILGIKKYPEFPFHVDANLLMKKGPVQAFKKWKTNTAVGGGPVLVQWGQTFITNEQELKFAGKAINDKHPRTCMGYTPDGYLIVMVIQGRFPGTAEGATLSQEAKLLIDIGCDEALNLDGGGSSCMLINGKETIKPSEKAGQRPVPAVFIISER